MNRRLTDIPIWVFHGEEDMTVDIRNAKNLFDTVNSFGGNIKLTTYPGVGHNA